MKGLGAENGEDADTYLLTLFSGEIPAYSAIETYNDNVIVSEGPDVTSDSDSAPDFAHTFTGDGDGAGAIATGDIYYNGQLYDHDNNPSTTSIPADGKYWVRMKVDDH